MQIEVFADVVCPWCYIGKRRLEDALAAFPHADAVSVRFRSFQLDPSTPKGSDLTLEEMLAERYDVTLGEARGMTGNVTQIAATAGLDLHLDQAHPANTFDAHRLLHFAVGAGRQTELTERLMHAYFVEARRVDDLDELVAIAGEAGLDPARVREVLAGNEFAEDVEADLELARDFGASGVPFFVFNRQYAISGAQETAVFADVLQQVWDETSQAADVAG